MANHSRLVVHCHPAWQMVPPAGCTRAANAALHQRHGYRGQRELIERRPSKGDVAARLSVVLGVPAMLSGA